MTADSNTKAMRPRDIPARFSECLKAGDLEGIVSLFHPDCVLCFPPGQPPQKGRDAIREMFKPLVAARPTFTVTVTGEIINGDTAITQADHRLETPDGKVVEGKSTEVARRLDDGSWVYYIDCPVGPPPPQ